MTSPLNLFLGRPDFESACRKAGMTDLSFNADTGQYDDPNTQRAYAVWETVANTAHVRAQPPFWLLRRRGKDVGLSVSRPYVNMSAEEWERRTAMGWEAPLALWPAMPVTSASEHAILSERRRQKAVKGYSPELDMRYVENELQSAADAYVLHEDAPEAAKALWPWPHMPMKKETRLRALEKACALLIAEHERLSAQREGSQ